MDLENIGTSAFSVELLKSIAKDAYEKGRSEGFDVGFTAALCTIASVGKKRKRRGCSEVRGRLRQRSTSRQRRKSSVQETFRGELRREGLK